MLALRNAHTLRTAVRPSSNLLSSLRLLTTSSSLREEAALNRAERLKSRFWKTVTLQPPSSSSSTSSSSSSPSAEGFQILLDNRAIRTPSGQPIIIPCERELLATCIAQEWSEQDQVLKPHTLPLTSLAARALEGCKDPAERQGIEGDLLRYLENETICFQEPQPSSLVKLQKAHWEPLLSHINNTYSLSITPFTGLLGGTHPPGTLSTFTTYLSKLDPFDLAAFERSVMLTKSFLISVALVSGHLDVEQAAKAAEVEVQSQIDRWGAVEDSHDVDQAEMRRTLGSVAIATVRN
ncbi:related to ATP12 - F1F0-ATPase complex assembly protein [Ustilago trichophora]|uniref:Related to ATP12 - F1F0-ATPase complex assembly protein n=1 Tax=Ustilago trichophora TaxID=86804 RepID=A0A5C3E5B9_9BASI|nr:related to ATP12 - F1F0-ATPase complex assembly protein [Ustilago trichophora]